jgi:hypothetical protein
MGGRMTGSGSQTSWDPWTYGRDAGMLGSPADVVGFGVEAPDGSLGTIELATYDAGSSYLLVDTGPWIHGSRVMLPAGIVGRVDRHARKIYVQRSRDEIKNAPALDQDTGADSGYRDRLGQYYGMFRY